MATASHFVNRAMTRAGIKTAEIALEADEAQSGLDMLNDMLAAWEVVTPQGFDPVANLTDSVRVQRFSHGAIIDNLAVMLAPEFDREASPTLVASAVSLRDAMRTALVNIGDVNYPSTLPMGAGNNSCDFELDRRFFPADQDENF